MAVILTARSMTMLADSVVYSPIYITSQILRVLCVISALTHITVTLDVAEVPN